MVQFGNPQTTLPRNRGAHNGAEGHIFEQLDYGAVRASLPSMPPPGPSPHQAHPPSQSPAAAAVGTLAHSVNGASRRNGRAPGRTQRILVVERGPAVAHLVQAALTEVVPLPEVVSCTEPDHMVDTIEGEGPFDLLVAGPSVVTSAGLGRLELVRHEVPRMSIVLMVFEWPETSLEDVVRAGAVDMVRLPTEGDELLVTLQRALALVDRLPAPATAAGSQAAPGTDPTAPEPGKVFTVCSATGGCGKTFYATNLAYFLAHNTGKRVCIVDLDLQFGEVSTALRLRPPYSIYDLLSRPDLDDEDLAHHLEEYLVRHETGVSVLAAPGDPAEADRITPPDVKRILEAARAQFDYVIVDTPSRLSEIVLAAFDQSETLFGMLTLDLPSVRNMSVFLNTLDRLRIPADDVCLVLNKEESDVGIDVAQIEKLFPQRFNSTLPYAREVSRSINLGMPVLASSPQSPVSRRMSMGMAQVLPEPDRQRLLAAAPAAPGNGRSWLRRLLGSRRS